MLLLRLRRLWIGFLTFSTKLRWDLIGLILLEYLRVLIVLDIDCRRDLSTTRLYYRLFEDPTLYKSLLWEGVLGLPFRGGRILIIVAIVVSRMITSLLLGLHLLLLGHHRHPLLLSENDYAIQALL